MEQTAGSVVEAAAPIALVLPSTLSLEGTPVLVQDNSPSASIVHTDGPDTQTGDDRCWCFFLANGNSVPVRVLLVVVNTNHTYIPCTDLKAILHLCLNSLLIPDSVSIL